MRDICVIAFINGLWNSAILAVVIIGLALVHCTRYQRNKVEKDKAGKKKSGYKLILSLEMGIDRVTSNTSL